MKRRRNLVVALIAAVVAFVATACDVSDKPTTSWQANSLNTSSGDPINVYATARIGSLIVLGGNFNRVYGPDLHQSVPSGGLAAFDAATGTFRWTATPGGTVYKIVADRGTLWVAGSFGLKKYDATGHDDTGYRPDLAHIGSVRGGLAVGPGAVYLAGQNYVTAVSKTTGARVWRTPVTGGQVWTLSYAKANPGPRIIAGGYFCTVGGVSRPGLASLGTNGAVDARFRATAFGCVGQPGKSTFDSARSVLASTPYGTTVYVGGGGSLNQAAQVDVDTGRVIWAAPRGDGDVQAVAVQGSYLYIGGHFDCLSGARYENCAVKRQKAARYQLAGNQLAPNWAPDFRSGFEGVWTITGDADALYVGGNFSTVNGVRHQKFVIFRP